MSSRGEMVEITPDDCDVAACAGERQPRRKQRRKIKRMVRDRSNDPPAIAAISAESGFIVPTLDNLIVILTHDSRWSGVLGRDEMAAGEMVKRKAPPWPAELERGCEPIGPWTDNDSTRLAAWFFRTYAMHVKPENAFRAARVVADGNRFHAFREYLRSLETIPLPPGESDPLDTWTIDYLGAPDTAYVRLVSRWFLISAVARVMEPGCKVDTMLILEGSQGLRKSSAIRMLFGAQFTTDQTLDLHNMRSCAEIIRGKVAVEWAELSGIKASDAERVKAFLSTAVDRFRVPWDRHATDCPRGCVFVGTVNPDGLGYLKDSTGARRFWPVKCNPCGRGEAQGTVDLDGLAAVRDRLWAYALAAYGPGPADRERGDRERWYPVTLEERRILGEEQDARQATDTWEDAIRKHLDKEALRADPFVTTADILRDAIGMELAKQETGAMYRAGRIIGSLGWNNDRRMRGGARQRGFTPGPEALARARTTDSAPASGVRPAG